MPTEIIHQFSFSHSPEQVWSYLTDADLMELWLMKHNFKPVIGCEFQCWTGPMPNFNFDGIIYCRVLELIPFKKLSYSWKGGPRDGKIGLDSLVAWRLIATDRGTDLVLEHTGFREPADSAIYSIMGEGWLKNIHKIAVLIKSRQHDSTIKLCLAGNCGSEAKANAGTALSR